MVNIAELKSELILKLNEFIPNLLVAIIIAVIGAIVIKILIKSISPFYRKTKIGFIVGSKSEC